MSEAAWNYELRHYDFGLSKPGLQDEYEFREYVEEARYESLSAYDTERDFYSEMYRRRNHHTKYLPDFFHPTFQHWVEIKGEAPNSEAIVKARNLARRTNQPVTILWGSIPNPTALQWGECSDVYGCTDNVTILGHFAITYGIPALQTAFAAARRAHFQNTTSTS